MALDYDRVFWGLLNHLVTYTCFLVTYTCSLSGSLSATGEISARLRLRLEPAISHVAKSIWWFHSSLSSYLLNHWTMIPTMFYKISFRLAFCSFPGKLLSTSIQCWRALVARPKLFSMSRFLGNKASEFLLGKSSMLVVVIVCIATRFLSIS